MLNRRDVMAAGLGMATAMLVGREAAVADLEPDGMSMFYRRHALYVVGERDDRVAGAVVDLLARTLPQTRARLARAADVRRIGVLIGTKQQDVAVMARADAEALFHAKPPFADIRDLPLRAIVALGGAVLVCRSDYPSRPVFLLAQALVGNGAALPAPPGEPTGIIPKHPGSCAFFAGDGMPV